MNRLSTSEEHWFWAAALFKAVYPERPRKRHLWERTVFLVRAVHETAARERAREVALGKELEYVTATGEHLRWTFQELESVQSRHDDELGEGTEVYWEFFERVDRPKPEQGRAGAMPNDALRGTAEAAPFPASGTPPDDRTSR